MRIHTCKVERRCAAFAIAFVALLISSCANFAGPAYSRPKAPWKHTWSERDDVSLSYEKSLAKDFWREFDDPYLNRLIEQALSANLDLRLLAARIEAAGAVIGQERARALPSISAETGLNSQKVDGSDIADQYAVSGTLNWEIDIWGRVRKGAMAQEAEFRASQADWRAGYLTLVSDVSTNYFEIRRSDEAIAQLERAMRRNRGILTIYESRFREGLVPQTQFLQQGAEISGLENQRLDFVRRREVAENGLATLLGTPAGELDVPVAGLRSAIQVVEVPAGLPSQLLSRRPDILAAEYRVLAAHNRVGEARLAKLPSLSLTGRAGTSAFDVGDLAKSWTYTLAETLVFPLFDPSRNAQIEVNETRTRVAEEQYRVTVITAFEEVESALANLSVRRQQSKALGDQLDNLRLVAVQVQAQIREGIASQLELFEAERSLLSAELALLENHYQRLTDTVQLYKALGGGWSQETVMEIQ